MSRIFESLKPVANLSRNAFDKSRRDVFSTKTGILTPCFVEDTIPDSVYEVNCVDILRTDSIQSAPFARMSQNMEYYFIPYSQIFRDFDKLLYERGDSQRNVTNNAFASVSSKLPTFSLSEFVPAMFIIYAFSRVYTEVKLNFLSSGSALQYYRWFTSWQTDLQPGIAVESLEKVVNDQIDYALTPIHHNDVTLRDVHGRLCAEDVLRTFDLLGYGNFLPVFKTIYSYLYYPTIHSYVVDIESAIEAYAGDYQGLSNLFVSLYNGIDNAVGSYKYFSKFVGRSASIMRIAAYMKVWSDFYRNSQYDVNVEYSYFFNYDFAVTDALSVVPFTKVYECLKPRYRQYKKDIFTGCYPTAQFGSVAVAANENPSTISIVDQNGGSHALNYVRSSNNYYAFPVTRDVSDLVNDTPITTTVDTGISALSIRQALALQNYKERILRAGNRMTALQRAVFGDNSRYLADEYVDFIGACHSNIDFNSVAATSESGSFNVGELASNGISTHGGEAFKYHSHDHGILLGIFYVLPESEYDAFGIDRFNTMTESSDFYKPDFANLGLAPVFNFDFNYLSLIGKTESSDLNKFDSVIGYLARYWQYKTSVDKVHGEFYGNSPLSYGYVIDDPDLVPSGQDTLSTYKGAFSDMVTPRDYRAFVQPFLASLYVSPTDVDNIFYAQSDLSQASDQFKVNMSHVVKCVLPMSVIGLPQ